MSIPANTEEYVPIPANTEEYVPVLANTDGSEPIPEKVEESVAIHKTSEESDIISESTDDSLIIPGNVGKSVAVPETIQEFVQIPKNVEVTSEESDIISESTDDSLIIPGNVGKSVAVPKTIQEFVQIPKNVEASTAIPTNVAKFLSISDYIKKSKQVPRHIEASVAKSKNLKESVATSENIEEAMEIPKNTEECDTIPENLEESLKYIETIEESLKIIENIEDSLEIPKNTEEIVLILEKTKAFVPIPENIEKCEPIHKNIEESNPNPENIDNTVNILENIEGETINIPKSIEKVLENTKKNIEESNPNPENIDNTVNILENIEGETINIPKSIEKVLENTKVETLTSSKNFSREPNIPENSQEMENKFDNTELPIPTASEKIITENIMDYGKVETDSKTVDSGNAPVIDTGIRSQNSLEITESSSTGTFETALDSKNFIPEQHEDNRGTISPTSTDLSGVEKMLSHQNRLTSKIDLKKMSIVNHANEESNNESNSNRGDTCALNEAPEEKVNYLDRYGIQHCYVNLDTIHIEGNTVSGTLLEKLLKKCRNKQEKRIICQRAKLKRELNRNQSIKPDVLSDDDYVFSDEEPVENYKRQRHEQKGKFFTVVSLRNKEVIKYLNCSSSDSEESDDNYSLCSDGPLSNEPDSESEENEIDTRDTKSTQNLDIKNVRVMLEPIDHLLAQNNSIKLNPKILKELACKVKRKELINKGIQVANKENQLCSQSDKPSEMLNNSMDEFKQKIHPKLTIKKVRSKCQNERFHPIVNPPCEAIQHDPKVIKTLEFEEKRKALDKEIEMFLRKDTNVRLVSSETEVPFDHKRKSTLHVDLEKKYSGSENKESPKSVQHLLKTPHSKDIKTSGNGNIRNNDIVSECINTSTKIGPNTNLCNTKNSLPKNAFESEFESFTNGLCKIINIPSKGKKLIQIKTQNRNVCSKTPSKEICTSNSTKKVGPLSLNCVSDKFGAPNQICPQKKQFINRTNFLSKHIKTTLSPSTQSICKTMEFNTKSIVPTKNKPSGCQDILTRFENNPKYVNISIKESSKTSTDVVSGQVKSGKSVPKMPVSKINLKTVETSTITAKQSIQNATSVNAVSCVSNCQTSTPSKQLNTIPIKLGRPRKLIPPFKNVTLTKTVPKNTSCSKTNVSAISTTNVVKGKPRVKLIRPQIKKVIVEHLNKKEKGPATDRKLSDMYPSQNKKTDETKISETSTKDNEILQEPSVKCMLTQHQTTAPCGSTPPQHFEKTCQVKAQNENYKPESNGISVAKYSEMTNLNELSVDFDHSFPTPSKPSLQSSCSNPNLQLDISDSTLQDTFPYVEADALEDLFPDSVLNTTELFPQATSSELLLNLQEVSKVDSQVTSTVTDTSIAFPTYQSQAQTNINTFVATPHPPDSLFNNVVLEPPVKSHQMNSDPSNTKSPKLLTQKLRALRPFQGSSQNKTSSTALTKEDGTSSIESSKQATLDEPLSSSESLNSNSNQSQYDVKVSSNMFDINFHDSIPSSPAVNPKPDVNATPPSNSSTSFLVPSSLSTSYASLSCPSKTFVNINSNPIPSISLVNSTPEPNIPITFFNINIVGSPSTSSLSVVSEQKSPNSPLQVASTSNTSHILNITPVSSCATSFNNMAPSSSTSYMTIVPQEPNPMMSFNSNEQCLNMENSLLVPNMEANSLNSTAPAITLTESNAIKFGSNISSQDNYGTSHVITYNTFESRQKETQYSTQQVNHSFLQPMDSFPDSLVSQQTSDLNKASPSNKTSPKSPRKAQKRKSPCVSSSCYSSAINSVISTYSNNFSPNIPNEYCPSVDKIKLSPLPPIQSLNSTLPVFQVPSNNDINISPATPIQMSINTAD
ncbi:mucin-17-like [Diaphorina citri]|uniref:Mucin-17-like n=1 Tax=Diaphorina citri TaxID=121845 RepID=A0A3Q0IX42_DIACI|nr:mucin-17-like [Diaphorina citri]